MKTTAYFVLLFLPFLANAHPGHGSDASSLMHYLLAPHSMLAGIVIAATLIAAWFLTQRRLAATRAKKHD